MRLFFEDEGFDGKLQRSVGKADSGMANVGECLTIAAPLRGHGAHRLLDRGLRPARFRRHKAIPAAPPFSRCQYLATSDGRIPTVPYHPEQWHDFATSFAGAAGALLGLAFVAISLNLDQILQHKTLPRRAVETLAFFAYPLAASLLIQLPGLSDTALGIGQAILAAGLIGLAAAIDVPRWRQERGNPLSWRLGHFMPAVVVIVLAIVGAAATITTSFGGLYWLAAAMAVATAAGLINSWVLLVEIKR